MSRLILDDVILHRIPVRHDKPYKLLLDDQILSKDIRYGGRGYFAGLGEGILTVAGKPARREIWLISLTENRVVRSVWSERDGAWFIGHLDPAQEYMIIARDHDKQYAPFAWDHRRPATEMTLHEQLQLLRERGYIIHDHDHAG